MSKRVGILGLLLLAACGGNAMSGGTQTGDGNGNTPSTGSRRPVATSALSTTTTQAKVVVKTWQSTTSYSVLYQGIDSEGTPTNPFTCNTASDCTNVTGAQKDVACVSNQCANPSQGITSERVFFTQNFFDIAGGSKVTFYVPCDTTLQIQPIFVAEVYGSASAHTDGKKNEAFDIQEVHVSDPFTVDKACTVVDAATMGAGVVWDHLVSNPLPTLTIPTIYAGLPAPYDHFTVSVGNLRSASWSPFFILTETPDNISVNTAGNAVFSAPTSPTDTATRTFAAPILLDSSALTAEDITSGRTWTQLVSDTATPVMSVPASTP
jgi:hypothetical protein